jgi:hypothetical protein
MDVHFRRSKGVQSLQADRLHEQDLIPKRIKRSELFAPER